MARSLYDASHRAELLSRLDRLRPDAVPAWGRMTPPKMVAHLTEAYRMPSADLRIRRRAVPFRARPGQAKRIPAGSEIILQLHYTATGRAGEDRTRLGLVFAKEPPRERLYSFQIANPRLRIPPGAPDHDRPVLCAGRAG